VLAVDSYAECAATREEYDQISSFISSNPPSTQDLIELFAQNTNLTLAAATHAVELVLTSSEGCSGEGAQGPSLLRRLRSNVVPFVPQISMSQSSSSGATSRATSPLPVSGLADYLALPTVYHKLMFMCWPDSNTDMTYTGVCHINQELYQSLKTSSVGRDNPTFDISTSTDISRCSGEACKKAATAVLDYQELLHSITQLRLDTIHVMTGASSTVPAMEQSKWYFQRSCDAVDSIVSKVEQVVSDLPDVVAALHRTRPQLAAFCVSPARRLDSSASRAARVLGEDRALANSDIWASNEGVTEKACVDSAQISSSTESAAAGALLPGSS